jgi:LPPG:FO 2-phospho-L-lactate transferase
MKIVALAGGVGGAKLVDGLAQLIQHDLTVIVNTGDDFEHFGLNISPDLDTVCYTLAGKSNPEAGWGLNEETWQALNSISTLGGPDWFKLGDKDLGTHLERTRRLKDGFLLSQVTESFCAAWKITPKVLPMTDDPVSTFVHYRDGKAIPFQEYFVFHHCEPVVTGFEFRGIEKSKAAPGVIQAIKECDWVIICPSNPWVSIDPILKIPGVREVVLKKSVAAVSPIISGKTIKGPAAKMFSELGFSPSAKAVTEHYQQFLKLKLFVFDSTDQLSESEIAQIDIIPYHTNTIMQNRNDRKRLAKEIITFCQLVDREGK